jgi:hypothetical protein
LFPLTAPFWSAITNSHTPTTSKTEIQTTKTPPKMMGFVSNLKTPAELAGVFLFTDSSMTGWKN